MSPAPSTPKAFDGCYSAGGSPCLASVLVRVNRVNRKMVLIGSDVVRAALLILLPFASEVWHV